MGFKYVYLTFVFSLVVILVSCRKISGPYRATLVRTEKCGKGVKESLPYDNNPSGSFQAELYNSSTSYNLMRGNATVTRLNKNLRLKFRGFYKEKGRWALRLLFNNIGCKGDVIMLLTSLFAVHYDKNACATPVGNYSFQNLEFNGLAHRWASEREYGRLLWVVEAFTKRGTIVCWEAETLVEPADDVIN